MHKINHFIDKVCQSSEVESPRNFIFKKKKLDERKVFSPETSG